MRVEFHSHVKRLLETGADGSAQRFDMYYLGKSWPVPKLGPRPPWYANPRYEASYPVL